MTMTTNSQCRSQQLKLLLIALLLLISTQISRVHCTQVKWTSNPDPNTPEAAKVPRSQKYW
jgi:hypothetical protein